MASAGAGRAAQTSAALQDMQDREPGPGLQRDLGCLAQVRGGIGGPAGAQVCIGCGGQQFAQAIQVARVPGLGQRGGTDLFGGGQVARLGQHLGQPAAACPRGPARDVRDLRCLPGQLQGIVQVAGEPGGDDQAARGSRLAGRVIQRAGHGQGAAAASGRLRDPAEVGQVHRLQGQAVHQGPGRLPVPDHGHDRGAPLQRFGWVGRALRHPGEPELRGAPPATASLGAPGQLTQ